MIVDMYKWSEMSDEAHENADDKSDSVSKHHAMKYFHPSTCRLIYDRRLTLNLWYHLFHSGNFVWCKVENLIECCY